MNVHSYGKKSGGKPIAGMRDTMNPGSFLRAAMVAFVQSFQFGSSMSVDSEARHMRASDSCKNNPTTRLVAPCSVTASFENTSIFGRLGAGHFWWR